MATSPDTVDVWAPDGGANKGMVLIEAPLPCWYSPDDARTVAKRITDAADFAELIIKERT